VHERDRSAGPGQSRLPHKSGPAALTVKVCTSLALCAQVLLLERIAMFELIKVQCPKCGGFMKEKARKIRGGYAMKCTHCATAITFDSESTNSSIRQALSHARRLRRQALALN
jgi:tRNA(Ile2) C34 agmatinyltransferase TiaS